MHYNERIRRFVLVLSASKAFAATRFSTSLQLPLYFHNVKGMLAALGRGCKLNTALLLRCALTILRERRVAQRGPVELPWIIW